MSTQTRMTTTRIMGAGAVALGLAASIGFAASSDRNNDARYKGDFAVGEGEVTPDTQYVARIRVLGAAVTAGGAYDVPITVRIHTGDDQHDGYGSFSSPVGANVNDHSFPKDYILPHQVNEGTPLSIETTAWLRNKGQDGDRDSEYSEYMTISSTENSPHMIMLRNGDDIPDVKPFDGQTTIRNILHNHVNEATGKVVLYEDEVLLLFEFNKDLNSAAADYQDLILLVGLAEDESYFTYVRIPPLINFD